MAGGIPTRKAFLKSILNGPARWMGMVFRFVPSDWIALFISVLVRVLAISRPPEESLQLILSLEKYLYGLTGLEASRYGKGVHPKHRLTGYHDFFCNRLSSGEAVLDIGCGNGNLTYDMAEKAGARVTGIELSENNYRQAIERYSHPKVTYIHGDALTDLPNTAFDTVVMSNVLEHLEDRIRFLTRVKRQISPARWLFRVPLYERDWRVPLMKEIGVDYRLDPTHCIEYVQEDFVKELNSAGLEAIHMEIRWGEIWCEARSASPDIS